MYRAEAVILALCLAGASAGGFFDGWWELEDDSAGDAMRPQEPKEFRAKPGTGPKDLCMGELEQWKICLAGTTIQNKIPETLQKCKFGKPLFAMEQKCPKFQFLNAAFKDLVEAGTCGMTELGLTSPAGIAYMSGSLPASMALSMTASKHDACMTKQQAQFNNSLKKCKYSPKIKGLLKKNFVNVADVKCFLDLAYDACDDRAKVLLKALMKGMNLISG